MYLVVQLSNYRFAVVLVYGCLTLVGVTVLIMEICYFFRHQAKQNKKLFCWMSIAFRNKSTQTSAEAFNNQLMRKYEWFFYSVVDPDQSQNLMGSKLDQDPSSDFFMKFQPVVFA